jgi:hypothetical protein
MKELIEKAHLLRRTLASERHSLSSGKPRHPASGNFRYDQAGKIEHVPVSPPRVNTVARPMSAAKDQRYHGVVAIQT